MIPQKWQKFRPIPENDRITQATPDFGTKEQMYACQELRCTGLPLHGHSKRPYIVWKKQGERFR